MLLSIVVGRRSRIPFKKKHRPLFQRKRHQHVSASRCAISSPDVNLHTELTPSSCPPLVSSYNDRFAILRDRAGDIRGEKLQPEDQVQFQNSQWSTTFFEIMSALISRASLPMNSWGLLVLRIVPITTWRRDHLYSRTSGSQDCRREDGFPTAGFSHLLPTPSHL